MGNPLTDHLLEHAVPYGSAAMIAMLALIVYFVRHKNHYELIYGTITKLNICNSNSVQSYVQIDMALGGGRTQEVILVFDTRTMLGKCQHLEAEECFHGSSLELRWRLRVGKEITVKTREFVGKERKVFQLVMPCLSKK